MVSAHDVSRPAKSPFSRFCSLLLLSLSAFFLTFHVFIPNVFSSQVTLAWDPNTEPELAGYNLYSGTASGDYAQVLDVGDTTMYTVTNLTAGNTYYFAEPPMMLQDMKVTIPTRSARQLPNSSPLLCKRAAQALEQ